MNSEHEAFKDRSLRECVTPDDARRILQWPGDRLDDLLNITREVRLRHFGRRVDCCAIVNAKSGLCPEDCGFCAQSARHSTRAAFYPLLDAPAILRQRAVFPESLGGRFSIVTSGAAATDGEIARIGRVASDNPHPRIAWCASLGMLDEAALRSLRAAGFTRYHHNLETARSHFSSVCTTHTYEQRVATVRAAQRAGLSVCAGVLFGLGESPEQRIEVAFALRELAVDSIPVNVQVPVEGTRLAACAAAITELDILRALAMIRLVCPRQEVRLCGGREYHLKTLESRIFDAGVTGIMIGGYLTVGGRDVTQDLDRVVAAGYTPGLAENA